MQKHFSNGKQSIEMNENGHAVILNVAFIFAGKKIIFLRFVKSLKNDGILSMLVMLQCKILLTDWKVMIGVNNKFIRFAVILLDFSRIE